MAPPDTNLLAGDEPTPVRVLRPRGTSDFVLAADHAGRLIPRALGTLGVAESELTRHIAWDIGIAAVTEALSELLDAAAVLQTYSRLVIDCNRSPGHPTSIPAISELTPIPGNEGLPDADRERRRRAIFDPYHAAIAALLDERGAAGRRTVLVAMHSFTPVFMSIARSVEVGVLITTKRRSRGSCSSCCGRRVISRSAPTSPMRSPGTATTRSRCTAKVAGSITPRSKSGRI